MVFCNFFFQTKKFFFPEKICLGIQKTLGHCQKYTYISYKKNLDWFSGSNFDPGILDEWPEGIRILRKLAKRSDDSEISRRRLKTKFVGDVEVVVKGNVIYKRDEWYICDWRFLIKQLSYYL